MFSLISGVYEYCTQKPEIRILMIGLDGAGKSTILERVKYIFKKDGGGGGDESGAIKADKEKEILLALSKISPTVGLNIGRLDIRGANVIIWDLGGDAGLRGIWDKYYADAHAILWVVDSADPTRFVEAKETLARVTDDLQLEGIPLMLLANKSDVEGAIPAPEVQNSILCEQRGIQKRRQVRCASVSGQSAEGLKDSIIWLVDSLKRGLQQRGGV